MDFYFIFLYWNEQTKQHFQEPVQTCIARYQRHFLFSTWNMQIIYMVVTLIYGIVVH